MNMPRQKAQTAHGEVEYETVTCDSCESEVMKSEAFRFVTFAQDEIRKEMSWHDHHEWEVYDGGYRAGWACPYCHDAGPADFPRIRSGSEKFNALYKAIFLDDLGMWRMATMAFFMASLALWITIAVALIVS